MHPHSLLRMSLVVAVAFIACFTGCGKQEKPAPVKMPQVSKEPAVAAADTGDIFKEFYSEDSTKKKAAGKSKKAAKQETFSPSSSSSSFQPEFSAKGRYTVQISCVRAKSFAEGMVGKMKDKGYPAYVAEVQNPTPNLSGAFYRVRIGGFDALSAAKSFGENVLAPSGNQYWVDKKSNDNVGMEGYGLGSGSAGSNAASRYDNAAPPSSSYQPAAATTSSFESSNSPYSSPSSSSSSSSNASTAAPSGSMSSTSQPSSAAPAPAAATTPLSSPTSTSTSPAASSTASTAPSSATPAAAASSAPASTPASSSTTGKTSSESSLESGWGTDSASKSGW
jgi:SPOR domain